MEPESTFLLQLIDHVSDGVYFVTPERRIVFWNKAAENITGYKRKEIINRLCYDNLLDHISETGQHLCNSACPLALTMQDGKPRQVLAYLRHKQGHRVPIWIKTQPMYNATGQVIGAVETFAESSPMMRMRQQLQELKNSALSDPLTGIGNRRYIEGFLKARLTAYKELGIPFGVAMLDLDFFKKINDTFGHNTGDKVLRMVAQVLRKNLRSDDSVGRWGGEEFLAVITGVSKRSLQATAEKLRIMVEESRLAHEGFFISITVSIGATLANIDDTPASLIERADRLLYQSKNQGRNRVTTG